MGKDVPRVRIQVSLERTVGVLLGFEVYKTNESSMGTLRRRGGASEGLGGTGLVNEEELRVARLITR